MQNIAYHQDNKKNGCTLLSIMMTTKPNPPTVIRNFIIVIINNTFLQRGINGNYTITASKYLDQVLWVRDAVQAWDTTRVRYNKSPKYSSSSTSKVKLDSN